MADIMDHPLISISIINLNGNNYLKEQEWGRINYLASKARLSEGAKEHLGYLNKTYNEFNRIGDMLDNIQNNTNAQEYMKEQHPNISKYQDLPFDIDIDPFLLSII